MSIYSRALASLFLSLRKESCISPSNQAHRDWRSLYSWTSSSWCHQTCTCLGWSTDCWHFYEILEQSQVPAKSWQALHRAFPSSSLRGNEKTYQLHDSLHISYMILSQNISWRDYDPLLMLESLKKRYISNSISYILGTNHKNKNLIGGLIR